MSTQEMYDMLKDKGFDVSKEPDGVYVKLNRSLRFREIDVALKYQVEPVHFVRITDNSIFVPGWE